MSALEISSPSWPEWISALSSAVSALAVVVGLFVAFHQLNSWRTQTISQKKAETAEKIVTLARSIQDVLEAARSTMITIPKEKADDRQYPLEMQWSLVKENQNLFDELRAAQFKAQLFAFGTDVDVLVNKIFDVRKRFWLALTQLAFYADADNITEEERSIILKAKREAYAGSKEEDSLASDLTNAVDQLEVLLGPIARHNPYY